MAENGAITNSVNIPESDILNSDAMMKSKEDLRAMFTERGIDMTKAVAFSCNSGMKATLGFAAAKKAGFTGDVMMYDGSYSEWKVKQAEEVAA